MGRLVWAATHELRCTTLLKGLECIALREIRPPAQVSELQIVIDETQRAATARRPDGTPRRAQSRPQRARQHDDERLKVEAAAAGRLLDFSVPDITQDMYATQDIDETDVRARAAGPSQLTTAARLCISIPADALWRS